MHYPVPALSKHELIEGLKELLAREKACILDTLEWLIYVNRYKPFLDEGYFSLYDYLERGFSMTKNQAFKRHTVVRQIDFFPELMQHLRSGALRLSHIVVLSGHLTEANYDVILPRVLGQPVTEARRAIAEIGLDGSLTGKTTGYLLQLDISEEMRARLLRVRALLGGRGDSASFEKVIDTTLSTWLERNDPVLRAEKAVKRKEKKRLAEESADCDPQADLFEETADTVPCNDLFEETGVKQPGAEGRGTRQGERARHIPAQIRHKVTLRDEGRCSYVSPDGVRCTARTHLQFDHKIPFCRGGVHSEANLRLLCFPHNQLVGRQLLGRSVMGGPPREDGAPRPFF